MDWIWYLLITGIIVFAVLPPTRLWWGTNTLYVLGIGALIAANTYTIGDYPIPSGNLVFGIDSVMYTLFILCILFMYEFYGRKNTIALVGCCVGSVLLTAVAKFIATWAVSGVESSLIWSLVSFVVSAVASVAAILLMLALYKYLRDRGWNYYVNIIIGVVLASIINSFLYFGAMALFTGGLDDNFLGVLAGSYIGKAISLIFVPGACALDKLLQAKFNKTQQPELTDQKPQSKVTDKK